MDASLAIEEFLKADLRTGRIETAQPVPDSKKLLRLEVRLGDDEVRQIIAGIAPFVTAEELVGQECVIVANLEAKKLAGLESQGMLLASSYTTADGSERISLVKAPNTPVGSRVR